MEIWTSVIVAGLALALAIAATLKRVRSYT